MLIPLLARMNTAGGQNDYALVINGTVRSVASAIQGDGMVDAIDMLVFGHSRAAG
jgi:hypothetical protein